MSKLNEFKDMVGDIKDPKLLDSGRELLSELMELETLKYRISEIEKGLMEGGKAALYFFASELTDEELPFALENITGRAKFINKNSEKE